MNGPGNYYTERIESEEKDKYHILTHIYRISKNGSEEFIYRAAMAQERKEMIGA